MAKEDILNLDAGLADRPENDDKLLAKSVAQGVCHQCCAPIAPQAQTCANCGASCLDTLFRSLDQSTSQAPAPQISVHRVLGNYAQNLDVAFCLGENAMDCAQVFQPESVMPVIALDALRIWQDISVRAGDLGAVARGELGVRMVVSTSALFPYAAYPGPIGQDVGSTLRLLTYLLAARRVLGLREGARIDLTPMLRAWDQIAWSQTDSLPPIPVPNGFDPEFMRNEMIPMAPTTPAPEGEKATAPKAQPAPVTTHHHQRTQRASGTSAQKGSSHPHQGFKNG